MCCWQRASVGMALFTLVRASRCPPPLHHLSVSLCSDHTSMSLLLMAWGMDANDNVTCRKNFVLLLASNLTLEVKNIGYDKLKQIIDFITGHPIAVDGITTLINVTYWVHHSVCNINDGNKLILRMETIMMWKHYPVLFCKFSYVSCICFVAECYHSGYIRHRFSASGSCILCKSNLVLFS